MKDFLPGLLGACIGLIFVAGFIAGDMASSKAPLADAVECSDGCKCNDKGGCKCFAHAHDDQCRCQKCTCEDK